MSLIASGTEFKEDWFHAGILMRSPSVRQWLVDCGVVGLSALLSRCSSALGTGRQSCKGEKLRHIPLHPASLDRIIEYLEGAGHGTRPSAPLC